ncbi:hypothetical protein DMB92_00420 [Campylobacter sp. MIT 99-7217]|uniref:P-loop NTPase fold protein n=1 Tax=Campylobacter sp. MIT 99-7217 TaxID=535091 RepID=UPI0011582379|nr:P-loop NTPase fold protein [Campylobacter sp. MIT 99-7217]TQR34463.1 hypothetical protein DMB92_00420 [Campylobacter sp. MIT 99-7217]
MNELDYAEYVSVDRKRCKEKIKELFKENETKPIAIAINGKWGVGKSHFYKNEIVPLLKKEFKKNPIYTSVFGKKDENEIIKDLVSQFLTIENKKTNIIRKLIKGISNLFGKNIDLDLLFEFLKIKDMSNTIVCIDDFERLSDKIPVQDILGLICELKENKECSVIVIYNEDELFKNSQNKEVFGKYKEKVFDFQIKFSPSTIEQFSILDPKLDKNFDAYKYFPDIINIDKLLENHQTQDKDRNYINLRELNKANHTYQRLLKNFSLEKYPSEEFKKIYNYILYPIAYAYHFGLKKEYFDKDDGTQVSILTSPDTSMYSELLKYLLPYLKNDFEFMQKTGFLDISSPRKCIFLQNFVKKIIDDTMFHTEYIKEWDKKTTLKEASISFFLKHRNDIKSIPYMFGYRILDYAFDEEKVRLFYKKIKSFALDLAIKEHKEEVLALFNQWCDEAYETRNIKGETEYFWISEDTFYYPLKFAFEKLNIEMPKNKLVEYFSQINSSS